MPCKATKSAASPRGWTTTSRSRSSRNGSRRPWCAGVARSRPRTSTSSMPSDWASSAVSTRSSVARSSPTSSISRRICCSGSSRASPAGIPSGSCPRRGRCGAARRPSVAWRSAPCARRSPRAVWKGRSTSPTRSSTARGASSPGSGARWRPTSRWWPRGRPSRPEACLPRSPCNGSRFPYGGRPVTRATEPTLGVIGGSGLYELPGLSDVERRRVTTPFGAPSDEFVIGRLGGVRLVFLPRHGRGHRLLPSELPFRANIYGLKQLGAQWVVAVSAVGSLREEIAPGHVVVPDQFIDRTHARSEESTFFGHGVVAHVQFADPVCPSLSRALVAAARDEGATVHAGGTYVCMEGPHFSTRAESHLYRSWGAHVIGMTNLQEAKLAREAELCFATLALATDYDCWNIAHADVQIEQILKVLAANVDLARRTVKRIAGQLPARTGCPCPHALEHAIITDRAAIPAEVRRDLDLIAGRYL